MLCRHALTCCVFFAFLVLSNVVHHRENYASNCSWLRCTFWSSPGAFYTNVAPHNLNMLPRSSWAYSKTRVLSIDYKRRTTISFLTLPAMRILSKHCGYIPCAPGGRSGIQPRTKGPCFVLYWFSSKPAETQGFPIMSQHRKPSLGTLCPAKQLWPAAHAYDSQPGKRVFCST